ncbi:MAG: hypothetical protein ACE5DZ_07125 [Mariprofundus sp.]
MTDDSKDSKTMADDGDALQLSLDHELRLLPQQLDLGNPDLLDKSLIQPFQAIEESLKHFAHSASPDIDARGLVRSIKSFIGKLNANPDIPLNFRLQILNRFEQELSLFDSEMVAAVLSAHKIAIMQVHQAAKDDNSYSPVLLDMISNAIELAIKRLLIKLRQYKTPSIIITRQFFGLARLGLEASASLGDTAASETARMNRALCTHEMLRRLNFFGKTQSMQQTILQELQHHIDMLEAKLFCGGDNPQGISDSNLMFINLNRPNDPGRIIARLPDTVEYDCFIIPLDSFIKKLDERRQKAEIILHDHRIQQKFLHIEKELESALIGCRAILDAVKTENREARLALAGIRIRLSTNLPAAIIKAFTCSNRIQRITAGDSEFNQTRMWNVIDLSQDGICLERIHARSMAELPDSLVGLNWFHCENKPEFKFIAWKDGMDQEQPEPPGLGFIRWARENRGGAQRVGIEFLDAGYKLARAALARGQREVDERPVLPVLVKPGHSLHTMIFPGTKVYKDMTFAVLHGNQQAYFKIREITHAGQNYALCAVVHARKPSNSQQPKPTGGGTR